MTDKEKAPDSTVPDRDAIATAWQNEFDTRLKEIATGAFQAQDWRQTIREIRQEIKKVP